MSKAKDSVITRNTNKSAGVGGAGDITFGGKPMKFGRKKVTNQIDGFDDGLGDIDDDGKIKKSRGTKNTTSGNAGNTESGGNNMSGASGGREFIHFGSKPREFNKEGRDEENKDEGGMFKSTGVKPTFKRREPKEFKNATNDGDDIRPSYDFKVSYKTSYDDKDENGEKRERKQRDKGVDLDTFNKKDEAEDDDEF